MDTDASPATPSERTESHFEYGLSTQAWVLFISYFLGAIGAAAAGGMLTWGVFRSTADDVAFAGRRWPERFGWLHRPGSGVAGFARGLPRVVRRPPEIVHGS